MIDVMYPGIDSNDDAFVTLGVVIYTINEVVLRTFVGISLISVFFTFVTDEQQLSTSYRVLW